MKLLVISTNSAKTVNDMDKIARIRAEIERRMKIYKESNYGISLRYQELEEILSFLDTLSEEPDKEDLNDAIKKFIEEYGYERGADKLLIAIVARHFAEWQASQMPMPEDTVLFQKGVEEGRRLEREDMMKVKVKSDCTER